MQDALRRLMLAAEGAGGLRGEGVRQGSAEHPVCGDLLELDLRLEGTRILELAWRAQACPATLAVAAAAHEVLPGAELEAAEQVLRRRIAELGGLDRVEQHALGMFLRALQEAAAA